MEKGNLIGLRNGRTFVLKFSGAKEWVPGLGVINTERFQDINYGDDMYILGLKFKVVKPTLEDIISNMEKITQAVALKDIGFILMKSGINQGSKVAEFGVGSGFLTVSILYNIRPGKVFGFDISEKNLEHVKKIMEWLGWTDYFTGIKIDEHFEMKEVNFDAVFVDIPDPTIYLKIFYESLNHNGRIIAYLPNITQVISYLQELRKFEFKKWSIHEILEREWINGKNELRPMNTGLLHTAFIVVAIK